MDIFEKISGIIGQQLSLDSDFEISEKTTLSDLNADSLDLVEIVMAIEDEFGIEIPDGEENKIHTVGDAVAIVSELI